MLYSKYKKILKSNLTSNCIAKIETKQKFLDIINSKKNLLSMHKVQTVVYIKNTHTHAHTHA